MPSSVSAPKMTIGITTSLNTLGSTIPMPSSNAVTTLQIVRTIKRGENGSINVSMGPLEADCAALFAWPDASLIQNAAQALHDIRHAGHGYDTRSRCEAT